MTLEEKVHNALTELEPRLEELTEGHAELLEADPEHGRVTLKLIGGYLNGCGEFALGLWAEKLLKEKFPEIKEVLTVDSCELALKEMLKEAKSH